MAMSLHDEEVARTIQEKEDKKYFKQKRREEMDAKIGMQLQSRPFFLHVFMTL